MFWWTDKKMFPDYESFSYYVEWNPYYHPEYTVLTHINVRVKPKWTRHRILVCYKNTVFGWTLRDDVVKKHWTIKITFYTMCFYFIVKLVSHFLTTPCFFTNAICLCEKEEDEERKKNITITINVRLLMNHYLVRFADLCIFILVLSLLCVSTVYSVLSQVLQNKSRACYLVGIWTQNRCHSRAVSYQLDHRDCPVARHLAFILKM